MTHNVLSALKIILRATVLLISGYSLYMFFWLLGLVLGVY